MSADAYCARVGADGVPAYRAGDFVVHCLRTSRYFARVGRLTAIERQGAHDFAVLFFPELAKGRPAGEGLVRVDWIRPATAAEIAAVDPALFGAAPTSDSPAARP